MTQKSLPTYNLADVAKLFRRVDQLSRENAELQSQVRSLSDINDELKRENEEHLGRLVDFENYYARQRTTGRTVSFEK
ncbi:MAG: hypothetical protein JO340_15975 [Acidobacteriaceae bacterium]|nr:hypothetical protein [Acidobacteriaceae bacterium]